MRYSVKIDSQRLPAGLAAEAAGPGETECSVITSALVLPDSGSFYWRALKSLTNDVLSQAPESLGVRTPCIDTLVIETFRTGDVQVTVNEAILRARCRPKRAVEKDEPMFDDDIVDIEEVFVDGVTLDAKAAIVLVLSLGWEKLIYFDFTPLPPTNAALRKDFGRTLAYGFGRLVHSNLYSAPDSAWDRLIESGWFPFVGLSQDVGKSLLDHALYGWGPDNLLPRVKAALLGSLPLIESRWRKSATLIGGELIIESAIRSFVREDYVAVVSIICPRIEGVLRRAAIARNLGPLRQSILGSIPNVVTEESFSGLPRLVPGHFSSFLHRFYFRSFDEAAPISFSRNAFAHGVVTDAAMSEKEAVVVILTLDHLLWILQCADPGA